MGDHIVTLVVSDNGGASDEDTLVVSVRAQSANASPTARFTHSCDALACTFDGRSSSDPDGGTLTYAWDFGDEGTGTGPQVQHTYAAPGGYTVTLRVTDPQGAAGTASRAVAVAAAENAPPVAAFTHACDALACTFDGSSSSDPEGGALTHAWDFGDGSQGSGATPSHTYAAPGTYHVVLTVEDPDGATDTEEKDVTASAPNGAPKPAYTESCDELDCSFDASASSDPDGDALTYTWDFGDGTTGAGATPTHTFPSSGTYVVELTATDDKGATASTSKSIAVAVDMPPVASFTHACEVRNCTFDGTGSSDPEGGALTYAWDFGNGATGEGPTPEVEYADAGTYVVSLIVTDPKGKTGTASTNVTIAS